MTTVDVNSVRRYELYVGRLKELADIIQKEKIADSKEKKDKPDDIRSIPELKGFIKIENLQLEATIVYDREGSGSKNLTQSFTIYNPNQETLQFLKHGNIVLLKAGYTDDDILPIICATEIIKVSIVKTAMDRKIILICSEAYSVRRNIKYNKTFVKGTPLVDVMQDILDEFSFYGVPTGKFFKNEMSNFILKKALPLSGAIYQVIEDVCRLTEPGYRWFIANGLISVLPIFIDGGDSQIVKVVQVNEDNVKNTIETMDTSAKKDLKDAELNKKGVKLTVNLNGEITNADGLFVSYGDYKGKYLISKVSHTLSFEGDAWDTTIECKG